MAREISAKVDMPNLRFASPQSMEDYLLMCELVFAISFCDTIIFFVRIVHVKIFHFSKVSWCNSHNYPLDKIYLTESTSNYTCSTDVRKDA